MNEPDMKQLESRYESMIEKIMREGSMSRRNAKKFLEKQSKKVLKQFAYNDKLRELMLKEREHERTTN